MEAGTGANTEAAAGGVAKGDEDGDAEVELGVELVFVAAGREDSNDVRDLAVFVWAAVVGVKKLVGAVVVVVAKPENELLVPLKPENPPKLADGASAGGGIAATDARLGRPRIFLVARTDSSAFLKPTWGLSSWTSPSEWSSLDNCFSAPRFMVQREKIGRAHV